MSAGNPVCVLVRECGRDGINHLTPLCCHRYSYKASCADRVKPSFVIFWHPGTLTLSPERQSGGMSKFTNDGLTRSAQDTL